MKKFAPYLGVLLLLAAGLMVGVAAAGNNDPPPERKVTICHAAGLDGTTHFITLTIGYQAVYGPGGHFYENGTPQAGHEQDYLGECDPIDVCPNLEGNQAEVPEGMVKDEQGNCVTPPPPPTPLAAGVTFTEATCTTGPSFTLVKTTTPLGQRPFYNVEGPLVDGKPVAGASYTITAIPVPGYVFTGQTVWTHTFAAAPTNCGSTPPPPPPHVVTGSATVICDGTIYRLSGTIDGQAADSVSPATLPGNTKGTTNVVVTRGDTSFRTSVTTSGDCAPTTTTTTPTTTTPAATPPPPPVTTPPATPGVVSKPPVAKPPTKVADKPKPKPDNPPKLTGNPKKDKCKPKSGLLVCKTPGGKTITVVPGSG